jgi:hypothetical protein
MCYERHLRRRDEAEESRELWRDFERTEWMADEPPAEVPEPERAEAREEIAAPER